MAIDSRSWLVHRREVGAAYRTELARELALLGFAIERGTGRGGRYFEIHGIPQALLDRWSSRHLQVQQAIGTRLARRRRELQTLVAAAGPNHDHAVKQLRALSHYEQLTAKEERSISLHTRSGKTPATRRELDAAWQQTGQTLGLSRRHIAQLRAGARETQPLGRHELLAALTEFDATFPSRDARAVALEQAASLSIPEALAMLDDLRARGEVLALQDATRTTREHRARERQTVTLAQQLAAQPTSGLPAALRDREVHRLDTELARRGGRLSTEQRAAIHLACSEQRLVVIEGHAGTGKSTTLTAIARIHQAAGQQIIVTSTAALAAERLAGELQQAGVLTDAYSTVALQHAIGGGHLTLGPDATIIHDEGTLASTREQHQLLAAVERSGARLIEVGDPSQNPAVGAGGLWPHLQTAAQDHHAHTELTHNQRAHDPADQRDQARFRAGEHEHAIRGYAARDRIHFHTSGTRAEDAALEAAHADRLSGRHTIVIAQASNEHLDALNARAQAIRRQAGELGPDGIAAPGRPYHLYPGDDVQVRHSFRHPDHGHIHNGTTGRVLNTDPTNHTLDLELTNREQITLDHHQLPAASLRLAYVQHPFPAQGHTTDTAHLIVSDHTTKEGTYVALTRARDHTHIHAADMPTQASTDRLQHLADRLGRSEPDLPSIDTPLAHEQRLQTDPDHRQSSLPEDRLDERAQPESDRRRERHLTTDDLASPNPSPDRAPGSVDAHRVQHAATNTIETPPCATDDAWQAREPWPHTRDPRDVANETDRSWEWEP